MEPRHQAWNDRHKTLRKMLAQGDYPAAIELFLQQHATIHSADVAQVGLWSFEDAVWDGLSDAQVRRVPEGSQHSIAWIIWHLSRVEDVTMNILVAEGEQLFERDDWKTRLGASVSDTGNALDSAGVEQLSAAVDLAGLRAYRRAVGRQTRAIVQQVPPEQWKRKPEQARLQKILVEGAVSESTRGMLAYWGSLTKAGLLLMPPTRHGILHLNEAIRLRKKLA